MPAYQAPGFRRIVGNVTWLMLDRVLRMGVGLFVSVWVARYLGPAQFGSLSFALAYVALFGSLTTLGLDGIVVREIVRDSKNTLAILGSTLALRLTGSFLALIASVVVVRLIEPHDLTALKLVSIAATGLIFQAFDTIDSYFQSQVQSKLTVLAKNGAFLLVAGLRIWLIHLRAPVWSFAVAGVAELALGAVGLAIAYNSVGGSLLKWHTSWKLSIGLVRQGWPLILSGMAIMIYMRIDMVMLQVMRGDAAAGLYAAAIKVSEVWYFIPMAIVSSVSPAIMRAKTNPLLYYSRLRTLFSGMILASLTIGSAVALASSWIVKHLYSGAYSQAAPVLAVHVWASVFVFMGVAQSPWDISENLLRLSFYRTAAGAIANIAMNMVLIPRYSALGAAIATVVSYALSGFLANAFDARTRPIFYLQLKSFTPNILSLRNSYDRLEG